MVDKIKNRDALPSCEPLGWTPLILGDEAVGFISQHDLPWSPASVEEILDGQWKPEGPVFLQERPDAGLCAYPVRIQTSLSPQSIFPFQFSDKPSLFGTPTRLKIDPENPPPLGTLYNPEDGRFYRPDHMGLKWYLVGDKENYRNFLRAAAGIWQSLFSFSNDYEKESLRNLESAPKAPVFTPEQAYGKIKDFLAWLRRFDPNLWRQVNGTVEYATFFNDGCSRLYHHEPVSRAIDEQINPLKAGIQAFFEPQNGGIYLMPHTIAMLDRREYRQAAATLIHENIHRINYNAGLVPPSQQLAFLNAIHFIAPQYGYGPAEGLRIYLRNDHYYHHRFIDNINQILCQVLPLTPEEEKSAFLGEIHHSNLRLEEFAATSHLEEALMFSRFLEEIPSLNVSPAWKSLAAQYVLLSQRTNRSTLEEMRIFDALYVNPTKDFSWTLNY